MDLFCVELTNLNSTITSRTLNSQPKQEAVKQTQTFSSQGSMVSHSFVSLSQGPRNSQVWPSQTIHRLKGLLNLRRVSIQNEQKEEELSDAK